MVTLEVALLALCALVALFLLLLLALAWFVVQELRTASATRGLTSGLSRSEGRSRASSPPLSALGARQPPPFNGETAAFKEWAFGVEIALNASPSRSPEDEVNFAASLLSGNARLWLMSALEAGDSFKDWPALRDALAEVYGPRFNSEQARLSLFALKQFRNVDHFTSEFTRLSLQVPELDDHTRALLYRKWPSAGDSAGSVAGAP